MFLYDTENNKYINYVFDHNKYIPIDIYIDGVDINKYNIEIIKVFNDKCLLLTINNIKYLLINRNIYNINDFTDTIVNAYKYSSNVYIFTKDTLFVLYQNNDNPNIFIPVIKYNTLKFISYNILYIDDYCLIFKYKTINVEYKEFNLLNNNLYAFVAKIENVIRAEHGMIFTDDNTYISIGKRVIKRVPNHNFISKPIGENSIKSSIGNKLLVTTNYPRVLYDKNSNKYFIIRNCKFYKIPYNYILPIFKNIKSARNYIS